MTVFQNGFSFCRILKKFQVIKFTLWIYNFKKKKKVIPNKNSKLIVSRNILLVINIFIYHGSSHRRCSVKNVFLKILLNWQEYTCARVSFLIKLQAYFIKKRLFSCEFCEIFKNTFFTEHPRATDFDATLKKKLKSLLYVSNEIVNISTGTLWISIRFLFNGCRCVVKAYSGQ